MSKASPICLLLTSRVHIWISGPLYQWGRPDFHRFSLQANGEILKRLLFRWYTIDRSVFQSCVVLRGSYWAMHNFRSMISLNQTPPRFLKYRFTFDSTATIITVVRQVADVRRWIFRLVIFNVSFWIQWNPCKDEIFWELSDTLQVNWKIYITRFDRHLTCFKQNKWFHRA